MSLLSIKNHGLLSAFYRGMYEEACEVCKKVVVGDAPVRVCKGCTVARYCSRECQTIAWPVHKEVCTSRSAFKVPAMNASLGCATMAELANLVAEWTVAHRLSLYMIATILIDTEGGADAALATPHTVIIDIKPATATPDGTPAMRFAPHETDIARPDDDERAEQPWVDAGCVAHYKDLMRKIHASPPHPDHIGVVLVLVYFDGSPAFLSMLLPLYRR